MDKSTAPSELKDSASDLDLHLGWKDGGQGEFRFRVDLVWAAGDPVSSLINVHFRDWSWKQFIKNKRAIQQKIVT